MYAKYAFYILYSCILRYHITNLSIVSQSWFKPLLIWLWLVINNMKCWYWSGKMVSSRHDDIMIWYVVGVSQTPEVCSKSPKSTCQKGQMKCPGNAGSEKEGQTTSACTVIQFHHLLPIKIFAALQPIWLPSFCQWDLGSRVKLLGLGLSCGRSNRARPLFGQNLPSSSHHLNLLGC